MQSRCDSVGWHGNRARKTHKIKHTWQCNLNSWVECRVEHRACTLWHTLLHLGFINFHQTELRIHCLSTRVNMDYWVCLLLHRAAGTLRLRWEPHTLIWCLTSDQHVWFREQWPLLNHPIMHHVSTVYTYWSGSQAEMSCGGFETDGRCKICCLQEKYSSICSVMLVIITAGKPSDNIQRLIFLLVLLLILLPSGTFSRMHCGHWPLFWLVYSTD